MNLIKIGTIFDAFGINGWVKIKTDTTNLYKTLYISINDNWQKHTIDKSYIKNNILYALITNISNRDLALSLKSKVVAVPREDFPSLNHDEFYWADLIGLNVINNQDESLGVIKDLISTGPTSVLVLSGIDTEIYIPFVAAYIEKVDLVNKRIITSWSIDY